MCHGSLLVILDLVKLRAFAEAASYGRSATFVPHFDGFAPMKSSSVPPWRMSLKSMYRLGVGFSVEACALHIDVAVAVVLATTVNVLPLPTFTVALSNSGVPMTKRPPTGSTIKTECRYDIPCRHLAHILVA